MALTTEVGPGAVLADRFRIRCRLGAGGTAAVFLVQDCVLCRDVAIKRLHGEGSDKDLQRFRREARLGASLSHPNLVTIFDTISGSDGVLIVMEYVRGRPLSDLIGPYGMAPRRVLEILRPVASALDYAHEHGVVHRDVKPANILIAEDRRVKLVDLGTATAGHLTQITAENEVMGTLAYIAPERLAGESVGEPAADVYSLAVVAFEALTGGKPYSARTPGELLARMESEGPDAVDGVPGLAPALRRTLSQGIDPAPERRQASAGALVRDLEAGLPNRASSHALPALLPPEPLTPATGAPRPSAVTRHDDERGRRIGWLLPALACLAALIAGGLWLGLSGSGSQRAKTAGGGAPAKHQNPGGRSAGSASSASTPSTSPAPTANTSAPSTASGTTSASSAATASATAGTDLNAQGYSLIQRGQYAEAVPVLRRAVAAFPRGTTDINYAYALFNLGHALRMSGHPEEAIPILERRLRIPDQTATVQAELDAARAAASG